MTDAREFRATLKRDLERFVAAQHRRFADDEVLTIDLHCHDKNSDVPDELLGRILRWPETWVETDLVREVLAGNGCTALTITNHNNARSCWQLLERGVDVLPGAEFTCVLPDFDVHVHVLTYGFTPAEEERLLALRHDVYRFLDYTCSRDLVTVLAHPLYVYSPRAVPTLPLLEKLTLMFDNVEALNGQRDSWQNLLVIAWFESLTEERVEEMAERANIAPDRWCRRPVRKALTGGSDDHMALFVGTAGSRVQVPNLGERLADGASRAQLVLEGLRRGAVAPFGGYTGEEKLAASFLDYFCQVAQHAGDPGLLRLLLHQGSARQKLWAFLIANGMFELRRHRTTSRFVSAAHAALHGKRVGLLQRRGFGRDYRPLLEPLDRIARARREDRGAFAAQLATSLPEVFTGLSRILAARIKAKVERHAATSHDSAPIGLPGLVERLELPADLRALFGDESAPGRGVSAVDLKQVAEGLPFPALAAAVVGGSTFVSTAVQFANRPLLDEFSRRIGRYTHPRRALWLTDTFGDRNGVAGVLQALHGEVTRRDLSIDFAVCHPTLSADEHLHVLRPLVELPLPYYEDQPLRAFDLGELQRLFINGGYDRVVCSTEGLMGLAALYLKSAFSVPAHFYVHTDWLDFARRRLSLDARGLDRVRRLLRAFYRSFDGLFVLSGEHRDFLASSAMGIAAERLHQTAHWPASCFAPRRLARAEVLPQVEPDERVLLYAGRLSEEKGVLELPEVLAAVRRRVERTRLVVAGSGPAEAALRAAVPDAVFLSWLEPARLAEVYAVADLLLLPSRFDTFGCVVLEALACGLPVVAYRSKGPREIIEDGSSGFTVETPLELAAAASCIVQDPALAAQLRAGAIRRAAAYRAEPITDALVRQLGLAPDDHGPPVVEQRPQPEATDDDDGLGAWLL